MLKDFKPTLFILLRFLGIYLALVFIYQSYLNLYAGKGLDPISQWISENVAYLQNSCGYNTQLVANEDSDGTWFYINDVWASIMVEGCNAISIMILFLAFIFAFYQGAKTFLYATIGLVILHLMNISRIMMINIVILEFPKEYIKIAHDYFFPAIIYGTVVVLWVIWIKFFVLKNEKNN